MGFSEYLSKSAKYTKSSPLLSKENRPNLQVIGLFVMNLFEVRGIKTGDIGY